MDQTGGSLGAGDPWPFVTCELGGGMTVAYHRRPHVDPEDVSALSLTKLGCGSSWQGFYMYHGGTQVLGERTTTQESHATGYPNDVPVRDYDFYAPLGAHGQERPHFHKLRRQHLMLESYGAVLAPLPVVVPEQQKDGPRWSVRADGESGFLFLNNHQPAMAALPDVDAVRFQVELAAASATVPRIPTGVPSGTTAMWPLRQPYGSIPALTATAQPVTELVVGGRTIVLFAASDGIGVELQIEGVDEGDVLGATTEVVDGLVVARPHRAPGLGCEVTVGDTSLVFLSAAQADTVWRGPVGGRDTIVLWDGEAWFDDGFRAVLSPQPSTVLALPRLDGDVIASEGRFTRHTVPAGAVAHEIRVAAPSGTVTAPLRIDGRARRLSAPTDEDFAALDPIALDIDDAWFDGVEQLILTIEWTGDALRLHAGDEFITDQFWSGRPLEVDLAPHRAAIRDGGLRLAAFAWNPAAGVHVDGRFTPEGDAPVLEFRSVVARPVTSSVLR